MKNISLIKKLSILSVLLILFGFLAFGDRMSATAIPCCRDCSAEESACTADCYSMYYDPESSGDNPELESCIGACMNMASVCLMQTCDPQCSGGCTDSSECGGYGCVCTGIRCVCF